MDEKTKLHNDHSDDTRDACNKRKRIQVSLFVIPALVVIILLMVVLYFVRHHTAPGQLTPVSVPSILGKYKHAALATYFICSEIGRTILEDQGGSSVDATIAIQICYSVVQPQSSGIGGGFFMVVYNSTSRESTTIDARDVAPLAATKDMFVNHPEESEVGGKSIAVPTEIRGYKKAHDKFGRLPWSALFAPSIKLCEDGFPVPPYLENYWILAREKLLKDPDSSKTYTDPATGDFYKAGKIIKLPALGKTLQTIATEGADSFYTGNLSKSILLDLKDKGSLITAEDLKSCEALMSKSIQSRMRDGSTMYSSGAPSGGPILIFIMNILDGYEIASGKMWKKEDRLLAYHRVTEAFKFAYAKRTDMGDPKFVSHVKELVANLTSMDYADTIRKMIWDNATHDWQYYGSTYYDKYKTSTAQVSVVGNDNLAVAVTTTINLRFGSGVMGSRTGIVFNDNMGDFSTPNLINHYGILPSPSNFIKPGKRPVSSISPVILVTKDNKIKMVLGAAGGTRIVTAVACVMTNLLWFGDNVKQAVDAPRIHHQLLPQEITYELGFPEYYVNGLRELGHNITQSDVLSIVNAITSDDDWYYANSDYRRPGGSPDGY